MLSLLLVGMMTVIIRVVTVLLMAIVMLLVAFLVVIFCSSCDSFSGVDCVVIVLMGEPDGSV